MNRRPETLNTCRICGAATSPQNSYYPFCGEHCREQDLGNWASEAYRIPAASSSEDDQLELESKLTEPADE